ncbi:uncharacterized protein LOC125739986 isoform X2 [Brienomyrus brachyistius]|uniref:uncharacterized protein LOC125739986 isoform X2 n=1 Tax=Brienomyrus brachyistius TaxID=42636 RepID=UPI0020B3CA11|nr:uncharacterized protein LOC125739986 isoform X2 [Brienomyrus brachyistius]
MKKYKSYLQASENNIPRTTDYRRLRLGRDKENYGRVLYKDFVSTSESDIPRTSAYRKRKTQFPVHSNEDEDTSVQNFHCPGPAKRPRIKRQMQAASVWSVADEPNSDFRALPHQTESLVTAEEGYNEAIRNQSQIYKDQKDTRGHQEHTANLQTAPDDSEGDELLYPGAPLSKGQSLLLLMAYILRHNLTGIALQHLLKMFNEHFPGSMPATSYLFHKAYGQYGQYEAHFYCSGCTSYIGNGTDQTQCTICHMSFDADTNLRNGSYFLVLNLSSQIKDILEKPQTALAGNVSPSGVLMIYIQERSMRS